MVAGDILVLYTDGVIELMNQIGEAFAVRRPAELIRENRQLSSMDMVARIIAAARTFGENRGFQDGLTLVIVRRTAA